MLLSGSSVLILKPTPPAAPVDAVLHLWVEARFEPAECRRRLEQLLEQRKVPAGYFQPEEVEKGGRAATDALLFDAYAAPGRDWTWFAQVKRGGEVLRAGARLPAASVRWAAECLRSAAHTQDGPALRELARAQMTPRFAQVFQACLEPAEDEASFGAWPRVEGPGLYRREHASLVVRSRTTTLVLDPQVFNVGEGTNHSRYPREEGPLEADAVLITHQHEDHWHLPAILRHAGRQDMPVIVPEVPRANLLTAEDFAASLTQVGLKAVVAPWGSTLKVGDIEVDVLPFYGEQPTRGRPGPAEGLRSWGNCYRFTTPEFSALVLVDAGEDPLGDMVEEVRRNTARRGPVDVLLSNYRPFQEGINPGLAHYALALPFEQLRRIYREQQDSGRWHSITLGAEGVAAACVAAQARYTLPYAHMFQGVGVDVDGLLLTNVRQRLAERGAATQALAWNPGDIARLEGGQLRLEPGADGTGR